MYSFIFNCSAQMGRQLYSWHPRSSPITGIHGLSLHMSLSHSLSLTHTHTPNHFSFSSSFSPSIQPRPFSRSTFSLGSFSSRHQNTQHSSQQWALLLHPADPQARSRYLSKNSRMAPSRSILSSKRLGQTVWASSSCEIYPRSLWV